MDTRGASTPINRWIEAKATSPSPSSRPVLTRWRVSGAITATPSVALCTANPTTSAAATGSCPIAKADPHGEPLAQVVRADAPRNEQGQARPRGVAARHTVDGGQREVGQRRAHQRIDGQEAVQADREGEQDARGGRSGPAASSRCSWG